MSSVEDEIASLKQQITQLEQSVVIDPAVGELETHNAKLRYQIVHLKRAIEEEQTKRMFSFQTHCMAKLKPLIANLYPGVDVKVEVGPCQGKGNSDYQSSVAFLVAKELGKQGTKCNPREVAMKICAEYGADKPLEKIDVSGPGFLNFYLDKQFINTQIKDLLNNGIRPPPLSKRQKIIVDFSSPNIAKEMHVGHLRSTIIGDTICRLLEFAGHDVHRVNHLGDWGTQFGMLVAHLEDKFPNYTVESPPISNLQEFYKESKKRFDEDPDFKQRAYKRVVDLQGGDPVIIKGWKLICEISMKEFNRIYERLDVELYPKGESFYHDKMKTMVERLKKRNLLTPSEGAHIIFVEGETVPLMVIKSDGGFTYDTSDLAAVHHRFQEEKADWSVYVVDNGQALHLNNCFKAARDIGFAGEGQTMTHVGFGVVLGEDKKKFKTRSGDTVKLKDLLDEGCSRAEAKIRQKEEEKKEKGGALLTEEEILYSKEAIAYGCIKYSDLSCTRTNDYVFSFDKMLDDRGKTAVYLLYALTRIRSIARNANTTPEDLLNYSKTNPILLEHEAELKLAKIILRFPEIIEEVVSSLCPHTLCSYLYDISTVFTNFYDKCYCIEKKDGVIVKVHMDRLLLCEATAQIMEKCFDLLGIKTVSRM